MQQAQLPQSIIYLHGFQSSSRSQKAQAFESFLQQTSSYKGIEFVSPDLPFSPAQTLICVEQLLKDKPQAVLMGSSMGGFFAAYCSQVYCIPAVLINPVVDAGALFSTMLGQELENIYTHERYRFMKHDLDLLDTIANKAISAADILFVLLETGDEVLDYRLAEHKYESCPKKIITGGNHRFQHFENCLPEIMKFYSRALDRLVQARDVSIKS